jgi:hypothetical protein
MLARLTKFGGPLGLQGDGVDMVLSEMIGMPLAPSFQRVTDEHFETVLGRAWREAEQDPSKLAGALVKQLDPSSWSFTPETLARSQQVRYSWSACQ